MSRTGRRSSRRSGSGGSVRPCRWSGTGRGGASSGCYRVRCRRLARRRTCRRSLSVSARCTAISGREPGDRTAMAVVALVGADFGVGNGRAVVDDGVHERGPRFAVARCGCGRRCGGRWPHGGVLPWARPASRHPRPSGIRPSYASTPGQPTCWLSFSAPHPCQRSISIRALTLRRSRRGYAPPL
jgi:hypothetical protein